MDRARTWAPRVVAVIGFAGYALLAPPGPYWLESSELAAAGFQLGSPQSTGFPLVCMLGKLASLVPVGELGFRFHLLSAACAALAMLWTARVVTAATSGAGRAAGGTVSGARGASRANGGTASGASAAGLVGGLAAALLVGVSLTFARQATIAGVHAPTAALLAATFLLFDRVARGGDARVGLLLALVVGLGLGTHASYRLLVPLPLLALLWIRLRRGARWPLAAPLVAISVGAALHLYLPIRSASGRTAAVDRGHPRELDRLAEHVGETPVSDPEIAAVRALELLDATAEEIGMLGLVAALAGAVFLAGERRSRWLLLLVAGVAAGDVVHAAWIDRGVIADRQSGVPLALACALLAGVGLAWLGRFAGRGGATRAGAITAAAAAMLLVGPAMTSWPAVSPAAAGDAPRRHAESALAATPAGGLLLTRSDSLSALVLFLATTEAMRPDVAPLARPRLGDLERSQALVGAPLRTDSEALAALLDLGRPVAWELGGDGAPAAVEMRSPAVGVLSDLSAPGPASDPRLAAPPVIAQAAERLAALLDEPDAADPFAIRAAAQALIQLGALARARQAPDLARHLFAAAAAVSGVVPGDGRRTRDGQRRRGGQETRAGREASTAGDRPR